MNTESLIGSAEWSRDGRLRTGPLTSDLLARELYFADPSRVASRYPRQRNYTGWYWFSTTGQHVWHESLLEASSLQLLDHVGTVAAIAAQPVKLHIGDKVHYPDFITLDTSGVQTVYDVKPAARLTSKALAQFALTADVCKKVGWGYQVLTELPDQTRVNLRYLGLFRHPGYRPERPAAEELLGTVAEGWTISDAVAALPAPSAPVARAQVLHLLWSRDLVCDLNARLSDRTLIRRSDPTQQKGLAHVLS